MRLTRAMIPAALLAITAVSSCTALKSFAAQPAIHALADNNAGGN